MTRATVAILFVLLLASSAIGRVDDPVVRSDRELVFEPHEPIVLGSDYEPKDGWTVQYDWVIDRPAQLREAKGGRNAHVWAPPGKYHATLTIFAVNFEAKKFEKEKRWFSILVRGRDPDPPDPKPPGPTPGPFPPNPTQAPYPSPGFSFLILYETQDTARLPVGQRSQLSNPKLLQYGNQHAVKVGGTPFYRIWDDDYSDADFAGARPEWKAAYMKVKASMKSAPWLAISNGKTGWQGPLPKSWDETKALLEKHRGN